MLYRAAISSFAIDLRSQWSPGAVYSCLRQLRPFLLHQSKIYEGGGGVTLPVVWFQEALPFSKYFLFLFLWDLFLFAYEKRWPFSWRLYLIGILNKLHWVFCYRNMIIFFYKQNKPFLFCYPIDNDTLKGEQKGIEQYILSVNYFVLFYVFSLSVPFQLFLG